jgi:hypothetical protein
MLNLFQQLTYKFNYKSLLLSAWDPEINSG